MSYTEGLEMVSIKSLYERIDTLTDEIKAKDKKIEKLQSLNSYHINDKHKQRKRVQRFIDDGGINVRQLNRYKMIFLLSLLKKGVINMTHKQIADACYLSKATVANTSRKSNDDLFFRVGNQQVKIKAKI